MYYGEIRSYTERIWYVYGRIRHRIRSFTTVYGARNHRPGYLNVRRIVNQQVTIVRRRFDKQLTAIVLVRVCLYVTTALPFIGYQIYQLNVPPNPNNTLCLAIDQLLAAVSYSFYFINYPLFNL